MGPGNASTPTVNAAAGLIVITLVIFGLYVGRDLLIPLALAGILTFILFPLVRRLANRGIPQGFAVALVAAALIAAVLGGFVFAGHQVGHLLEEVPRHEANLREGETAPPIKTLAATVIAGRGIIDHAAAELIADALRSELRLSIQCPSLGGLTGVSAAARAPHDTPVDIVVLVSVGEVTGAQLDLLVSRVNRIFEGSAIAIGYWGGSKNAVSLPREHHGGVVFAANTVDALVHAVGRIGNERTTNPQRPPPLKLV